MLMFLKYALCLFLAGYLFRHVFAFIVAIPLSIGAAVARLEKLSFVVHVVGAIVSNYLLVGWSGLPAVACSAVLDRHEGLWQWPFWITAFWAATAPTRFMAAEGAKAETASGNQPSSSGCLAIIVSAAVFFVTAKWPILYEKLFPFVVPYFHRTE
jgi:hypothetical protein